MRLVAQRGQRNFHQAAGEAGVIVGEGGGHIVAIIVADVALFLGEDLVRQHKDRDRALGGHVVGVAPRIADDFALLVHILDHNEIPGRPVDGVLLLHSHAEHFGQLFVGDLIGRVGGPVAVGYGHPGVALVEPVNQAGSVEGSLLGDGQNRQQRHHGGQHHCYKAFFHGYPFSFPFVQSLTIVCYSIRYCYSVVNSFF